MQRRNGLTDAEMKIMLRLWQQSPQSLGELTHALAAETGWAKNTVITLLKRMEQKGAISAAPGLRGRLYTPLVEQEQVAQEETRSLLRRMYAGNPSMLIASLVQENQFSDAEWNELESILQQARERHQG